MDKNTLSSYGWIVVLILILSVLLAFMTPFGNFIADGIRSFTGGFVDTNNAAMEQVDPNAGKIPADQCSHENVELRNQKSASCSANGYTGDEVCKDCNTTIKTGTVVNKTAHTAVTDPAVAATCEQKGKTEGSHCSVCKTQLVAQRETDALGHDWGDPYVAEQATCLGNGISRIACKRAGCDAHTDTTIVAKGHTIVTMKGKAATCTATGLTDGKKCSTCGTVTKAQTTIKALGHTAVTDKAVSATCTTDGKTEGSHCSVCNTVIKAQSTVSALGHQMGDPVVTLNATCESAGQTKTSCKRTGCGHYEVGNIPATGHNIVKDNAVAATCTATGLTAGEHCTKCNYKVAQTTVPMLNHTAVTDKAVSATCTTAGKTEGSHCSVCNTVIKAQTIVPALGHDIITDKAVSATCTTTGLTAGEHCSRCSYKVAQETVSALGHNIVKDSAVAATCTTAGKTEGSHCSVCGKVLVAQTTIPATGHTDTNNDFVCDNCNKDICEHKSTQTITVEATCTKHGTQNTICNTCGKTIGTTQTTEPLGHHKVIVQAVQPTCTTTGLTQGLKCNRCNEIFIAQEIIPALGHTDVDNDGYCEVCQKAEIPEGGTYYVNVGGTAPGDYSTATRVFTAGDPFPEKPYTGDVYVYGDYEYRYNMLLNDKLKTHIMNSDGTNSGWFVTVRNRNQTSYGQMLKSICLKPIVGIYNTFRECPNLVDASNIVIPETVKAISYAFKDSTALKYAPDLDNITSEKPTMYGTFNGCTSLLAAPALPQNVTVIQSAFYRCLSMSDISKLTIPNTVTDMSLTFASCNSLVDISDLVIPSSVETMSNAFLGCQKLTTYPDFSQANSLTSMAGIFRDCDSLVDLRGMIIPDSVTDMGTAFMLCDSLKYLPDISNSNVQKLNQLLWQSKIESLEGWVIPPSVTNMSSFASMSTLVTAPDFSQATGLVNTSYAFSSCSKLTGTININANPTDYTGMFSSTKLEILLKTDDYDTYYDTLVLLAETDTNDNVDVICSHKYTTTVIKESTCTENGEIVYMCTRCGYSYTETTPALGHTDNNGDGNCDKCIKYNVTLMYMDGVTPDNIVQANKSSDLPTPSRDGYMFDNWYLYEETSGPKEITTFTNPNSTYPWTQSSGVWTSGNKGVSSSKSHMLSEEFTLTESGSISFDWRSNGESNYDYLGYDILNVSTGKYLSGQTTPSFSSCLATLKGKASTSYTTVTYNLSAGTYKLLFMYGKDSSVNNNEDQGFVKNIIASGVNTGEFGQMVPTAINEDITVAAKWTPNTYTVVYKGNGATGGSMANSKHTYGTESQLTKNGFIKSGYSFVGWNTNANGSGTGYDDIATVQNLTTVNNGTVTLYAQWDEGTELNTLITKTWSGLTGELYGHRVWTDGTNTYYSYAGHNYIMQDGTWKSKTWKGYTSMWGDYIWTDGTNIYYSANTNQYVLSGDTWVEKTWNITIQSGDYIWTDGINIYYSYNGNYILNGDTWEETTWNVGISGNWIWTDGTNIYYSCGSQQYILNGDTWERKVWSGLTNPYSNYIWTDGTNIYYSYNSEQYVLNGDTWKPKTWNTTIRAGYLIYTDGTNTYYSDGHEHYILTK